MMMTMMVECKLPVLTVFATLSTLAAVVLTQQCQGGMEGKE